MLKMSKEKLRSIVKVIQEGKDVHLFMDVDGKLVSIYELDTQNETDQLIMRLAKIYELSVFRDNIVWHYLDEIAMEKYGRAKVSKR